MTRELRFQASILLTGDLTVLLLSWGMAYWIRFLSGWVDLPLGRDGIVIHALTNYIPPILFSLPIFTYAIYRLIFSPPYPKAYFTECRCLLHAFAIAGPLLVSICYLLYRDRFSRMVLGLFFLVSFPLVIAVHTLPRLLRKYRLFGFYRPRRILIFGEGDPSRRLAASYLSVYPNSELIEIAGLQEAAGYPMDQKQPDEVLIHFPQLQLPALKALLQRLESELIDIKFIPDWGDFRVLGFDVEQTGDYPIIHLRRSPLYGWNLVSKRMMDIFLSILSLMVLSPLFLIIAVCIVIDSGFPIFFRQKRMSLDGRVFSMFKFRSMIPDAEKRAVTAWTQQDDPRRTRIGAILRRLSLDELPQIFNILRGDMSFVGPRPEMAHLIDDFRRNIPNYYLRFKIKSGLTGWAQIHGLRGNTSLEDRIRYDLYYIDHWSLWLDIKILFLTIFRAWHNAY